MWQFQSGVSGFAHTGKQLLLGDREQRQEEPEGSSVPGGSGPGRTDAAALISCNKRSHILWLKTTAMSSVRVLEIRSLKSKCQQDRL